MTTFFIITFFCGGMIGSALGFMIGHAVGEESGERAAKRLLRIHKSNIRVVE